MINYTDFSSRISAANKAKSHKIRDFQAAFTAAQPAREDRLKKLQAKELAMVEARILAEDEAYRQMLIVMEKEAEEARVRQEEILIASEQLAAAKLDAERKWAEKEEAQRLHQAASAARRANSLTDDCVRQAERARRLAARH